MKFCSSFVLSTLSPVACRHTHTNRLTKWHSLMTPRHLSLRFSNVYNMQMAFSVDRKSNFRSAQTASVDLLCASIVSSAWSIDENKARKATSCRWSAIRWCDAHQSTNPIQKTVTVNAWHQVFRTKRALPLQQWMKFKRFFSMDAQMLFLVQKQRIEREKNTTRRRDDGMNTGCLFYFRFASIKKKKKKNEKNEWQIQCGSRSNKTFRSFDFVHRKNKPTCGTHRKSLMSLFPIFFQALYFSSVHLHFSIVATLHIFFICSMLFSREKKKWTKKEE